MLGFEQIKDEAARNDQVINLRHFTIDVQT